MRRTNNVGYLDLAPAVYLSEDGSGFTTDLCADCWTELEGGLSTVRWTRREAPRHNRGGLQSQTFQGLLTRSRPLSLGFSACVSLLAAISCGLGVSLCSCLAPTSYAGCLPGDSRGHGGLTVPDHVQSSSRPLPRCRSRTLCTATVRFFTRDVSSTCSVEKKRDVQHGRFG